MAEPIPQATARPRTAARAALSLLSTRLSVAAALVAGTLIVGFLVVSVAVETRMLEDLSRHHADALASALEQQLLDAMNRDSKGNFNDALAVLAAEHGVRARVHKPDGPVAFSWNPAELGSVGGPAEVERHAADEGVTVSAPLSASGGCARCHEPAGAPLGTMEISVPVEWLHARTTSGLRRVALLGAVCLVVLLGAAMFGFRHVSRRLRRLSRSMEAASRGDFSVRLPIETRDEIGAVSTSFNDLLAELHASKHREDQAHRREVLHLKRLAMTGELAAGTAHEIKNPLGAVAATIESMAQDEGDAEKRALLLRAHDKLKDIHTVMLGLLEFARPHVPAFETMDAAACAEGVLSTMEARIRKQGVALRRHIRRGAPAIQGDERLLGQVLINLLLNAMESKDQGLEIDVGVDAIGENGNQQARIWVRDNGPGIAARDQPRIFQPFYSTKRKGSGLGLAIARDIVLRHGGVLSFESRPGSGTCFCMFLPVAPADVASGGECPWP